MKVTIEADVYCIVELIDLSEDRTGYVQVGIYVVSDIPEETAKCMIKGHGCWTTLKEARDKMFVKFLNLVRIQNVFVLTGGRTGTPIELYEEADSFEPTLTISD